MNKTAIRFFDTLKWDLLDTIILVINHLLEPSKTGNYFNASFQKLIDSLDTGRNAPLISELKDELELIKAKAKPIIKWRNKWAAHRDFDVILGDVPKPTITLREIEKVLAGLCLLLNTFEDECKDPSREFVFDDMDSPLEFVFDFQEWERLKIEPPTDYKNLIFQDDGIDILNLIKKANSQK